MSFKSTAFLCALNAALLGGAMVQISDRADAAGAPKQSVSPEAAATVARMGKTLAADQFSFRAHTLRVYADLNGQPLHIVHTMNVTLRRPDKLLIDVTGDDGATKLFYDGKTTVLASVDAKKYSTIPSPNTLQGMLETVMGRLGVDFPLADFLTSAPEKAFMTGVTSGREINTVTIDGTPCTHLVFDQPGIQLELWVENTERAVPRRLIVTYHSLPDRPSFYAEMSDWKFDIHPTDAEFTFTPPEGAVEVPLKAANAGAKGAK
jgi:hypothetical protein